MESQQLRIAVIGAKPLPEQWSEKLISKFSLSFYQSGFIFGKEKKEGFSAAICTEGLNSVNGILLFQAMCHLKIPFFFISDCLPPLEIPAKLLNVGLSDVLLLSLKAEDVLKKIEFILSLKKKKEEKIEKEIVYKIPFGKRIFDIVFSLLLLMALSPLFLLIALLIKLESPGPILYISKRVGTGYEIFDFYKFRTMFSDADKRLSQFVSLNQYKTSDTQIPPVLKRCNLCEASGKSCDQVLYLDGSVVCERLLLEVDNSSKPNFIKFTNDPRVTKFGKFLRNISLDELPQVFNVFKGDMSFVGNRPLPLYEAEKLTTDHFITRFVAPAGITGLWQVSKRGGKGAMSQEERIELDNQYAQNFSFTGDLKIILKTFPALFQKENV